MGFLTDASMTARIKTALLAEPLLDGAEFNVDTLDDVVTLCGAVRNEAQRELAGAIARQHAPQRVEDELVVEPARGAPPPSTGVQGLPAVTTPEGAPPAPGPPPEEAVRRALADDDRVNEHLVSVRVENGVAYLTGRQDTVEAREAATEAAAHAPGIVGVVNDLEVLASV